MKKIIKMKKTIIAAAILTIVLFVFPLSSLAKGGKGGGDSLVCAFEGDITGLVFDFGDGFVFPLGDIGEAIITSVRVVASGQELTVVIPPKQFIYNANLSEGWENSDSVYGKIFANATLGNDDVTLEIEFDSATLFEQFKIKKKDKTDICADLEDITVPKKVDLFLEITNARLTKIIWGPEVALDVDTDEDNFLNLILVIDKGKLVLVDPFDFSPLPPQ
jgi:hypothetical protein